MTMQVSGINAGMSGGAAGAAGPSATGSVGGSSALGRTSPGTLQPVGSTALQTLVNSLQNFNMAEILMALLILAAMEKSDQGDSSSAAFGFLAGLALAGQLGQTLDAGFPGHVPSGGMSVGGTAGLTLNVFA